MQKSRPSHTRIKMPPKRNEIDISSPRRFVLVFAASAFVVELSIMLAFFILPPLHPLLEAVTDSTALIILIAPILYLLTFKPLTQVIAERNLIIKDNEELNQTLSDQVAERTAELSQRAVEMEELSKQKEHRAKQFEAVAQVARVVTSLQELDLLLPRVTHLISEQFGFYHVGIFLLDEYRDFAVLRATNSEGGKKMLAREHRLKVGQIGIVGYAAATGLPRIALDVGTDAVYFDNPDLPDTHSEIALPLFYARRVIGVLDVQSMEINAFGPDDVEVLSTLADQVAVAIQNALSLLETRKLLAEAQSAIGGYITEAWKILRPRTLTAGYQKAGASIKPLEKPLEDEHIRESMEKGETVTASTSLAVPIHLRGQIIGVMNLQLPQDHKWNSDEVDIAEAVAERLSLAIETATLIQATQRRANIERITADISGKIGSSTRFETILQTAAQELSRALGGSDVLVQIEPVAVQMSTSL